MTAQTIEHLSELLRDHAGSVRFYQEEPTAWMAGREHRLKKIRQHKAACKRIIAILAKAAIDQKILQVERRASIAA